MTDPNARHIAALWYAKAFGWKVFPVGAKSKKPMAGGLLSASDDATQVEQWFTRHPRANVGINLGASGLLVLDVDSKDGGDESFDDLMKAIELEELATPRAITGDGGSHYYLKRPTGGFRRDEISQAFKDQYPGISVLCDGDYVVAPPSIHPNGKTYEWADSAQPQNVKPTQAPTALIELATEGTKAMTAPGPPRLSLVQGTPSTDGTAAIEQAPAIQPYARTDLGNTERLVDWFGDDFRYCPALQKYLIWRNGRWK
ncbi:MAG: hypothetical protein GWO44_18220, partial [Thermoplasmata archaeon]|nr:hypothetical protein [Thermoplasmata archaeon]NIY05135.1 hypothetical protein [Thermoplasmata archaeon]